MLGCIVLTFETDVAVQTSRNNSTEHREDITGSLNAVFAHTRICRVDGVLPLVPIHEQTIEHVAEVEKACAAHMPLKESLGRFISAINFGKTMAPP
jgi:glutamate formiminotransferase